MSEAIASPQSSPLTILVTGANKGLGKETVRQLVAGGHTVFLGSRDEERGRIAAAEVGARPVVIDITNDESVASAVAQIKDAAGHVDVLINNAGMVGNLHAAPEDVTADDVAEVYGTNVFGTVRVMHAFLPLLQAADAPAIVNVSSGMGSLTWATSPDQLEAGWVSIAYASSKSALNMLTVQYSKAFPGIRVHAADPGLTATDGTGGMGKAVSEGATAIVRAALDPHAAPTAGYTSAEGPIPW